MRKHILALSLLFALIGSTASAYPAHVTTTTTTYHRPYYWPWNPYPAPDTVIYKDDSLSNLLIYLAQKASFKGVTTCLFGAAASCAYYVVYTLVENMETA